MVTTDEKLQKTPTNFVYLSLEGWAMIASINSLIHISIFVHNGILNTFVINNFFFFLSSGCLKVGW